MGDVVCLNHAATGMPKVIFVNQITDFAALSEGDLVEY